jgi:hypothetical protein
MLIHINIYQHICTYVCIWLSKPSKIGGADQGCRTFLVQHTETGKNTAINYGIHIPDGNKIYQMASKETNIYHCKTLQNLPKLFFFLKICHLATLMQTDVAFRFMPEA